MSRLALFIGIVLLSACASTSSTITDTSIIEPGRATVFGHVDVFVDAEKKKWGGTWSNETFYILVLPPNSTSALTYVLDSDGDFEWNLEPGEYTLLGYRFQKGYQSRTGSFYFDFHVPEESGSIYIGNIEVDIRGGRYITEVHDEFDTMSAAFVDRFPTAEEPTKGLLLPQEAVGNYKYVMRSACPANWGVECTDRYQGVKPIAPKAKANSFPSAESLTPKLEWEASSNTAASYDLVVYDAVSYSPTSFAEFNILGRVVMYEEDIKQPFFILPTALRPDSKYYWSV